MSWCIIVQQVPTSLSTIFWPRTTNMRQQTFHNTKIKHSIDRLVHWLIRMLPFSTLGLSFGIVLKTPRLVNSYIEFAIFWVLFVFFNQVFAFWNSKQFLVIIQFEWNKPRRNFSQSQRLGPNVINYILRNMHSCTISTFPSFTADLGRPECSLSFKSSRSSLNHLKHS